ncbi:MAG: bifunctional oligoribonuclease/PAP phosphatase NrnA [Bacilli bacterium]|nr:bifunctional oligoribonuclease/PAP phosphatase NrnA [Bacilli bacterium]
MYNKILNTIKQYDTIIISRHSRPDLDALGSQFGLKHIITENFPNKTVYVVGDMAKKCFLGEMNEITDEQYENALLIFTDVSVMNMIPTLPLTKAKEIMCIDHHKNECDINNANAYYDREAAAACQIIADFAFKMNLKVNDEAAKALYSGIISDTNRFNFSLSKNLFEVVGNLIDLGFDYSSIYNIMYAEKVAHVKMRAYFIDKFIVNEYGVAYLKNDASIFEKFKVDFFSISRGMVNTMANLEGVKIWCNFTEDPSNHKVVCEFRSKNITILPVAIKYGGGGHPFACGATVDSFDTVEKIINDMNEIAKEN